MWKNPKGIKKVDTSFHSQKVNFIFLSAAKLQGSLSADWKIERVYLHLVKVMTMLLAPRILIFCGRIGCCPCWVGNVMHWWDCWLELIHHFGIGGDWAGVCALGWQRGSARGFGWPWLMGVLDGMEGVRWCAFWRLAFSQPWVFFGRLVISLGR